MTHLGRPGEAWGLLVYQLGGLPAGEWTAVAATRALAGHAQVLGAAAGMALALAGAGAPAARVLRFRPRLPGERVAADLLLGGAVLGTAYLGLALAGILVPALVLGPLLPPAWAGGLRVWRARAGFRFPRLGAFTVLAWGPALVAGVFMLLPDTDGDAAFYHLAAPEQFLRVHRFLCGGSSYTFSYPLLVDVLSLPAVAWGRDALAHFTGVLPFGCGVALLAAWCAREGGPPAGWLAAWAVATYGLTGRLMILAKDDLGSAGYALAGAALLARGCAGRLPARLAAGGVLLGCGLASKYSGAIPLAVGVTAVAAWHARRRGPGGLRFAAWLGLALLPAAPWLAKNWLLQGDPLWPALSGWWPGALWDPASAAGLRAILRPGVAGLRPADLPGALASALTASAPAVAAALPLLLVMLPRGAPRWVAGAAGAALLGSWLAVPLPDLRYGLPALYLLFGAAAIAAGRSVPRRRSGALRAAALAGALAGWLPTGFLAAVCVHPGFALPWLGGILPTEGYLRGRLGGFATARAALAAEPGVRGVIVAGDVRSYGLPGRRYVDRAPGWTWEAELARTGGGPAGRRRRLRQLNATHRLSARPGPRGAVFRVDRLGGPAR